MISQVRQFKVSVGVDETGHEDDVAKVGRRIFGWPVVRGSPVATAPEEAEAGMATMSKKFREEGGEIYVAAEETR